MFDFIAIEKKTDESNTNYIRRFGDSLNKLKNMNIIIDDRVRGIHLLRHLKASTEREDLIMTKVDMNREIFYEEMKESVKYFKKRPKTSNVTDTFYQGQGRSRSFGGREE